VASGRGPSGVSRNIKGRIGQREGCRGIFCLTLGERRGATYFVFSGELSRQKRLAKVFRQKEGQKRGGAGCINIVARRAYGLAAVRMIADMGSVGVVFIVQKSRRTRKGCYQGGKTIFATRGGKLNLEKSEALGRKGRILLLRKGRPEN